MRFVPTVAALLLAAPVYAADEFTPALQAYMEDEISGWANAPEIVAAIKAQNEARDGITQAQIDEMDQAWRASVGSPSSDPIAPILNNPVSDSLRARVEESMGTLTEVFVMGAHGLNVAAFGPDRDSALAGLVELLVMQIPRGRSTSTTRYDVPASASYRQNPEVK